MFFFVEHGKRRKLFAAARQSESRGESSEPENQRERRRLGNACALPLVPHGDDFFFRQRARPNRVIIDIRPVIIGAGRGKSTVPATADKRFDSGADGACRNFLGAEFFPVTVKRDRSRFAVNNEDMVRERTY